MAEFTHDTAEDGFHEIQLSGKQLVFLFIVTTTVIVVVFLCGVKVGRGARTAAQGDDTEQTATSAAVSQPQPSASAAATVNPPPPAEAPAPPGEAPESLSYPDRLKGAPPADEKLKPSIETEAPVKSEPAPKPEPPARPGANASTRAAAAPEAAEVPTSGRAGTWVVQVIATRDRSIATSIVKRLTGKDYPAFLVNPAGGPGPGYYKVHVGRYTDRGEAERVSQRIKKEEQFQSWITR